MERRRPWANPSQMTNWRIHDSRKSRPQTLKKPGATFTRIDLDTKFYDGQDVEGIHLLTDFDQVRNLQIRLGCYSKGPKHFFPVNWPVQLSAKNIGKLTSGSYAVAPKTDGKRFLLYIDSSGEMFLENVMQHIFRVDKDHAVMMDSSDGRPVTDTVLDGGFCKAKLNRDDQGNGGEEGEEKLTFVIRDAIRCKGVDLTYMDIVERIGFVKEEIMKPRLYALENSKKFNRNEAFNVDIVEYREAYQAESYLNDEFEERFKYPLRAFIFFPRNKRYMCGTNDIFQWMENQAQSCNFRLRIPKEIQDPTEADLLIGGPNNETKCETIPLTDEIRKLDGCIVECRHVDHHWVFVKKRVDRDYANGKSAFTGKVRASENPVSRDSLLATLKKK